MKLKKISVYLFLFAVYTQFYSQMWVPATPYPGANGGSNNENYSVYFWGCGGCPFVSNLKVYENELYVGGYFNSIGGMVAHNIAKWNGTNWSTLGPGNFIPDDLSSSCTDIEIFNNELYIACGTIYKWDGITLINTGYVGNELNAINNELYIASSNELYKYSNNSLQLLIQDNTITFYSIEQYNNNIYLGTDHGLFRYSNGALIDCNGITNTTPIINDIQSYNGELYCVGAFLSIGGISVSNFAKYNGTTWQNISLPNGYRPTMLFAVGSPHGNNHLNIIDSKLYLAHTFFAPANPTPPVGSETGPVVEFNGTTWNTSGLSINHPPWGLAVEKYNGYLYSGGYYSMTNDNLGNVIMLENFIRLDNQISLNQTTEQIKPSLYPNPTSSEITFTSDKFTNEPYTLFDQMGRTVGSGKLSGTNTTISLSNLSKGIYILKVEGAYESAIVVKE